MVVFGGDDDEGVGRVDAGAERLPLRGSGKRGVDHIDIEAAPPGEPPRHPADDTVAEAPFARATVDHRQPDRSLHLVRSLICESPGAGS